MTPTVIALVISVLLLIWRVTVLEIRVDRLERKP